MSLRGGDTYPWRHQLLAARRIMLTVHYGGLAADARPRAGDRGFPARSAAAYGVRTVGTG